MLKHVLERAERTLSTEEKRQLEIMLNLYMDLLEPYRPANTQPSQSLIDEIEAAARLKLFINEDWNDKNGDYHVLHALLTKNILTNSQKLQAQAHTHHTRTALS